MDVSFKTADNIALWHERIFHSCTDVNCLGVIDGEGGHWIVLSWMELLCKKSRHSVVQSIDSF